MNLYADIILDHWQNPQNYGFLDAPDLEAFEANPLCGDEITIQLKTKNSRLLEVGTDGQAKLNTKIEQVRFSGNGCAISQASASILTEFIIGKTIKDVKKINADHMIKLIGITPGPARIKCTTLALLTVKKAIEQEYY
jgi:nitrogen fixation NifU-like protein